MTLYKKLQKELENHREFWNYYNMDVDGVFMNENIARDFIYNYFRSGSKSYALDNWVNSMNEYIQMRNIHTVNVFFIGAYLQRMIDENIAIKSEVASDYPFSYIWYLLCLAHDLGYVYERYSRAYLELPIAQEYREYHYFSMRRSPRFRSRKHWYQQHGIDIAYTIPPFGYRSKMAHYSRNAVRILDSNIEYNNGTVIRKPRYSGETKNNYFYYRLYEMRTIDHGIIGADDFFSKLIINYVKEYREMSSRGFRECTFDNFINEQGLHFCSEQFKIFAYIADCIASHNMYKADDNYRIYADYHLNALMPNRFEPISYRDNPLLFILCIADTIEPSKKFPDCNNEKLLKLISIDYDVNTNSLCVELDESLYHSRAGQEYVTNIEQLRDWCDIVTTVTSKRFRGN